MDGVQCDSYLGWGGGTSSSIEGMAPPDWLSLGTCEHFRGTGAGFCHVLWPESDLGGGGVGSLALSRVGGRLLLNLAGCFYGSVSSGSVSSVICLRIGQGEWGKRGNG